MIVIVGLGNPGAEYDGTRHNIGFAIVDHLATELKAGTFQKKFQGELAKARLGEHEVGILKPMTYMNLSGQSVQRAMQFFKVAAKDVVVVHDEIDLPFGAMKIKSGGGAAGHNGIRSIIEHCGADFVRVRVGVGKPVPGKGVDHVLGGFSSHERKELPELIERSTKATRAIVERGTLAAMNEFNGAAKAAPEKK